MSISLIQSYRNLKKVNTLIGCMGRVVLSTEIKSSSVEHEDYLPYCFLIVVLDSSSRRVEVQGESQVLFKQNDRVILQLRKISQADSEKIINYGLKACKLA